jgi:hypothetical protein
MFSQRDVTVITDPGKPTMEVLIKKGEKIEHYKASGKIGSGDGEKAGVAYRMKDGSMVYVPQAVLQLAGVDADTARMPRSAGGRRAGAHPRDARSRRALLRPPSARPGRLAGGRAVTPLPVAGQGQQPLARRRPARGGAAAPALAAG